MNDCGLLVKKRTNNRLKGVTLHCRYFHPRNERKHLRTTTFDVTILLCTVYHPCILSTTQLYKTPTEVTLLLKRIYQFDKSEIGGNERRMLYKVDHNFVIVIKRHRVSSIECIPTQNNGPGPLINIDQEAEESLPVLLMKGLPPWELGLSMSPQIQSLLWSLRRDTRYFLIVGIFSLVEGEIVYLKCWAKSNV